MDAANFAFLEIQVSDSNRKDKNTIDTWMRIRYEIFDRAVPSEFTEILALLTSEIENLTECFSTQMRIIMAFPDF